MKKEYITLKSAAEKLGCSRQNIDYLISTNRLTGKKDGWQKVVVKDDLWKAQVRKFNIKRAAE